MSAHREKATGRFDSLDGLRGAAALAVVFSHAFWLNPAFSDAVQLAHTGEADPFTYAFTYTPLHIFWLAEEAVIVFFVLSGFVLTRPFITRGRSYRPYYASRFVRLVLPAWAALLIAWVLVIMFYPTTGSTGSWLLDRQIGLDTSIGALKHFTLLTGVPEVLPPLWSLQAEVLFSLALPLFVVIGRWAARPWRAVAVVLLVLVLFAAGAYSDVPMLQFLPVFAIGAVLASNLAALQDWFSRGNRAMWLGVASMLVITAAWYPRGFTSSTVFTGVGQVASVLAAAGLIVAALTWRPMRDVLGSTVVMRWLGSRSFSLYLIHFPILAIVGFMTGGGDLWLLIAIGVPGSLLAAEILYRLAEAPSTRLSHAIRNRVRQREERHATGKLPAESAAAGQ